MMVVGETCSFRFYDHLVINISQYLKVPLYTLLHLQLSGIQSSHGHDQSISYVNVAFFEDKNNLQSSCFNLYKIREQVYRAINT